MDPLGVADDVVNIDDLDIWSNTSVPEYQIDGGIENENDATEQTIPFTYRQDLNSKIVLWSGNIAHLNANAIVNSTNEGLTDKSAESKQIYLGAGPKLVEELRNYVKGCRTGEAKITKGYSLPCRHVIHTVGPRYNVKYRTAAESALYSAYRNVLQLVIENKLTSVALCAINSSRRNYPVNDGTNIALRTVRRFLEQFGKEIYTIIFCVTGADREVYERVLPLYFPRSDGEAQYSRLHFAGRDVGDPVSGEPVVRDRQIRIAHTPRITTATLIKQIRATSGTSDSDADDDDEEFDINSRREEFGLPAGCSCVGDTDFAKMQSDVDARRKGRQRAGGAAALDAHTLAEEHERRYGRLLRRARLDDYSDLITRRAVYVCGEDRYGRPCVALIGHHLPRAQHDLDRLVLYAFHMMEQIVKEPYVFIYFHTLTSTDNHMEMNYIRTTFTLAASKYIRHLSAFYIVHPTFWTKVLMWYNTRFYLSNVRDKVVRLPGLEQLYARLGPAGNFDLPTFIAQYDLQVNGSNYYTVPVEVVSGGEL